MVGNISKSRGDFIRVYQEHLKENMIQKTHNQRSVNLGLKLNNYSNCWSAKLKYSFLPTIIWSNNSIFNNLAASFNLSVKVLSAAEGVRFPVGWLWATIMAVAPHFKACCNTNLISTTVAVNPPLPSK